MWERVNRAKLTPDALLHGLGMLSAPVNLDAVAAALGVSLWTYEPHDPTEVGYVEYDGVDAPKVVINRKASPRRQRFTLAHGLGHVVLHLHPGQASALPRDHADEARGRSRVEAEADSYGARLLMPATLLARYYRDSLGDVDTLAAAFAVGRTVMVYRVANWLEGRG